MKRGEKHCFNTKYIPPQTSNSLSLQRLDEEIRCCCTLQTIFWSWTEGRRLPFLWQLYANCKHFHRIHYCFRIKIIEFNYRSYELTAPILSSTLSISRHNPHWQRNFHSLSFTSPIQRLSCSIVCRIGTKLERPHPFLINYLDNEIRLIYQESQL